MNALIDAWREQLMAHERDATALRGGGAHVHGHVGRGGFTYSNRPLDPFRTDDPVLNSLFAAVVVSICAPGPARTRRPTPRVNRSCAVWTRWARLRPTRSSFHTTTTSPFLRARKQLSIPGCSSRTPEAQSWQRFAASSMPSARRALLWALSS